MKNIKDAVKMCCENNWWKKIDKNKKYKLIQTGNYKINRITEEVMQQVLDTDVNIYYYQNPITSTQHAICSQTKQLMILIKSCTF